MCPFSLLIFDRVSYTVYNETNHLLCSCSPLSFVFLQLNQKGRFFLKNDFYVIINGIYELNTTLWDFSLSQTIQKPLFVGVSRLSLYFVYFSSSDLSLENFQLHPGNFPFPLVPRVMSNGLSSFSIQSLLFARLAELSVSQS